MGKFKHIQRDEDLLALERHGHISPEAVLNWDAGTRSAFQVPIAARHFAFASPLASLAERLVENLPAIDERGDDSLFFVGYGGFLFWDERGQLCAAIAVKLGKLGEGSGLQFAASKRLEDRNYESQIMHEDLVKMKRFEVAPHAPARPSFQPTLLRRPLAALNTW